MLSRRDLVGRLAAGAAGAVVFAASGGRASAAVALNDAEGPSACNDAISDLAAAVEAVQEQVPAEATEVLSNEEAPPWELFRPLALGAVVNGWRLSDLSAPSAGACVLTLQNDRGRAQRVHVCRNDGRPHGLVYTGRFDLVVMNGGQGDLGTEENLAQAVVELSHVVAANENSANPGVVAALLPHKERLRQFADTSEWTLR